GRRQEGRQRGVDDRPRQADGLAPGWRRRAFRHRPVPQALPVERARRYRVDRAEERRDRQLRTSGTQRPTVAVRHDPDRHLTCLTWPGLTRPPTSLAHAALERRGWPGHARPRGLAVRAPQKLSRATEMAETRSNRKV